MVMKLGQFSVWADFRTFSARLYGSPELNVATVKSTREYDRTNPSTRSSTRAFVIGLILDTRWDDLALGRAVIATADSMPGPAIAGSTLWAVCKSCVAESLVPPRLDALKCR